MNWFWANVPLMAVFFAAWVGIPLWMVVRHRHWGPDPACPHGNPELEAGLVRVPTEKVEPAVVQAPAFSACDERLVDSRELVADLV